MPPTCDDELSFTPAQSKDEAIRRLFGLTGRSTSGTRGEKRALLALRDALALDVEVARTSAVLGRELSVALDADWDEGKHVVRNTVTLAGLNTLLEGAARAARAGSIQKVRDNVPGALEGHTWAAFQPARSKIEAVTRISGLTGAPKEWLGPGSKEHKSVLLNLANTLFPDRELNRSSKTRLGASLADVLAVPWSDMCSSTGESISLVGLNTLLAGVERHLGRLGAEISDVLGTPKDEGDALAAALLDGLPPYWDGRQAVHWLAERGLRGSNDNEWQGFYGEERARIALECSYTPRDDPPRTRYGNTVFDYSLNRVWDIKVHTHIKVRSFASQRGKPEILLNDEVAARDCIREQGLGFLVISGAAQMDETGDFVAWHRSHKRAAGVVSARSNTDTSRLRKAAFRPLHVESFWLQDTQALIAALAAGQVSSKPQGRQSPGKGPTGDARADKLELHLDRARHGLRVARYDWPNNS